MQHLNRQPGFTIVEVIVVMIILGVLGTLVVPRLIGVGGRQAEVEAQSVRVLLTAFAQRDAIARQSVALAYDATRGELSVQTLAPADDGSLGAGAAGAGAGGAGTSGAVASEAPLPSDLTPAAAAWRNAGLIRPVRLSLVELREVLVAGQPQPLGADWRVTLSPAQTRPALAVVVHVRGGASDARAWQIDLPSSATGATLRGLPPGTPMLTVDDQAQDLDKQGRRSTAW